MVSRCRQSSGSAASLPHPLLSASRFGCGKPSALACRIVGFDVEFSLAMVSPSVATGSVNSSFRSLLIIRACQPPARCEVPRPEASGVFLGAQRMLQGVDPAHCFRWEPFSILAVRLAGRSRHAATQRYTFTGDSRDIIVGFFIGFLYGDMGWQTSPIKRAPEQNQGGNAPADTSPAAGTKKNPQENTEMPDQQ